MIMCLKGSGRSCDVILCFGGEVEAFSLRVGESMSTWTVTLHDVWCGCVVLVCVFGMGVWGGVCVWVVRVCGWYGCVVCECGVCVWWYGYVWCVVWMCVMWCITSVACLVS